MKAPQSRKLFDPIGGAKASSAWRICFRDQPPEPGAAVRHFAQPRPRFALIQAVDAQVLAAEAPDLDGCDDLGVLVVKRGAAAEPPGSEAVMWLAPSPEHSEQPCVVTVRPGGDRIHWRPGRAVLEVAEGQAEDLLDAVIDFAFYEGELRRLEQDLLVYEAKAPEDVLRSVNIRRNQRHHWGRIGTTLERLAVMRLTFARLKAQLTAPARSLTPPGRRAVSGLLEEAEVAARLEGLSERLEACEDLYDGAVDRVNEYRWFLDECAMEITIIVLLLIEVVLMALDLSRH